MGHYHNKLDKKYFNKSVYVKKFEEVFNIKIKDYPLQYDILFDTFNTYIMVNNILFSLNYIELSKKVDNLMHTIRSYLNKYKNKIKKSYDSECILVYESLEQSLDELEEMKELHETNKIRYNFKSFEKEFEKFTYLLEKLHFDMLVDSKGMPFYKKANDKLPKKVNLKLLNDLDTHSNTFFDIGKQEQLNNDFVKNYSKIKFDLNNDEDQKYFIIDTLTRVKDLNNAMVDYYIYDKDKTVVDMFNFYLKNYIDNVDTTLIKDIEYVNVFNRLKEVSQLIDNDNIDLAFDIIKNIIKQYNNLYERMS